MPECPRCPPKPPNPQGTPFGESGTYLGGDEQEDVTQVGLEEKTQAHLTPKSLDSLEPLPPVPAFDSDDYNDKTLKRQVPPAPFPSPPSAAPELGPEAPTGVVDESAFKLAVDQHARELWTQTRPKVGAAWRWARQRPALSIGLAAAGVVVLVAAVWAMGGESAAELAARTVLLRPGNDGAVVRVVVEADERVRKGQLLLVVKADQPRMDSPELASLEDRLLVAQNALRHAKSGADIKKAAAEQLALATAKVHGAEERLAKATDKQGQVQSKSQAAVAQAQLDVARAKAALLEIRSPVAGVLVTPDPGQLLGKKVRGNDPLLSVRADEDWDTVRRPR